MNEKPDTKGHCFIYIKFKLCKIIYNIKNQDNGYPWEKGVTGNEPWNISNVLFLDPGACYTDVFTL